MGILRDGQQRIKIDEYQFSDFSDNTHQGTEFQPIQFETSKVISEDIIKQEREIAENSSFRFDSEVENHRGLKQQRQQEYEQAIEEEVKKRIDALKEEAQEAGYQEGLTRGTKEAKNEVLTQATEKIKELESFIKNVQEQAQEILAQNKNNIYSTVQNLTKWIVLKEVDEKYYLSRLLEKLIYEINQKNNLVVRVDEESFGYMPEIVKVLERKVGVLSNIRVEVSPELKGTGIILESENSIVDGSFEAQMNHLDEIFKSVGKYE